MKKSIKILGILVLTMFFIIIYKNNVKAASASVSTNSTSITVGETVTITTTINGASWNINLSGAITQSYADTTDDAENATKTYTASFSPSSAGTYTINLSGNVTDSTESQATPVSDQVTITVSNAQKTPDPEPVTTQSPSSNANLSNLGIRPNDFTGFRPATTTYNVTVPEDVESVEVYATASDSKATIAGTGNKTLQYGANALNVVVTAENGTTKTYTINVTREGTEENAEEQPEEDTENTEVVNGLSNITIKDLELKPAFSSDVYEYTVDYIGEATSLDIQTVATDPSYTVETLGNEELKEGENTITILVSDSEGNNVATYQLTVNKSLVDEEALAREEEQRQQEEQRRMFIIAGGIIALILIIVIIIIIKRRKNRVYAEEFSGVPFAGINDEDDYYDDYNSNDQYDDYNNVDTQNNQFPEEENQATHIEHDEDTQNVQDYDDMQETETLQKPRFLNNPIDDKELQEKESAKQAFLNGYNTDEEYDYDDDYEDEKTRKRKKGKRFK